ncbi:MAG TPA: O-antigen ligase family protein, partial [Candidatus Paceibacterota bacterium]|nr:O-antigen ligase family protein [Candidatus Paceibacterota bacterium]
MDGYINLLHLFLWFIIASSVLTAGNWWKRLFQAATIAAAVEAVYSVCQSFHVLGAIPSTQSGTRADGTFGNATYLAVYMIFSFFITLLLLTGLFKEKKHVFKDAPILSIAYIVSLVLEFAALFLTETRGSILGLVGGIIVAALFTAIFARQHELRILRRISLGALAAVVILVGAFFALKSTPIVTNTGALSRLASISLQDKTTASRFIIWKMALEGAKDKPVFGWGQENFNFVFNKYYDPAMYDQEQWFDRAHNEFLDWLVAGGAPAMLLYIALFLTAAWAIFKARNLSVPEQAVLFGLLAAYIFNNLFVFDNLVSLMYFYLILALVHGFSKNPLPGTMALSRKGSDQAVAVAAPLVLVAVVAAVWFLNAPAISRAQTLIVALETQDPQTALNVFKTALSQGELGLQETVEQLFQFSSNSIAPSTSASPDLKQEAYTMTQAAGLALEAQRPHDARIELFMGVFYAQFGQHDGAISELNKAIADSPQKQQILFQTGITYLSQGDTKDALPLFKKAYDLDPSYDDARIMYATGLYYAGQTADADKLLTDRWGTVLHDDDKLLQAYMSLKMYDRVIAIWNARVAAAPTDSNQLLGLAGAYFAMGNTQQTIATLEKAEQVDPNTKAQLDQIISQIQSGTLKAQ